MRTFEDTAGHTWRADVVRREGADYKGRFHLVLRCDGGADPAVVDLDDIRWNSARSAARTLAAMSDAELRRQLGIGRHRVRRPVGEVETGS